MNKAELIGRVTKEIELKKTQSGKSVASFALAVDRRNKENEADFINCVVWGRTAEVLAQYVKKGNRIGLTGRIQTRFYDRDGQRVYITEVVVEEIEFLENKASSEAQKQPQSVDSAPDDNSYDYGISDDDLPF